jgi:hypothetical protein
MCKCSETGIEFYSHIIHSPNGIKQTSFPTPLCLHVTINIRHELLECNGQKRASKSQREHISFGSVNNSLPVLKGTIDHFQELDSFEYNIFDVAI